MNFLNRVIATPLGIATLLSTAALLEVFGDACFQAGLHRSAGAPRAIWFALGCAVLTTYGLLVNVPRWDFGRLLGVYVVLFFLVAQVLAKLRFGQSPTPGILVGGALIVAGGGVIYFFK